MGQKQYAPDHSIRGHKKHCISLRELIITSMRCALLSSTFTCNTYITWEYFGQNIEKLPICTMHLKAVTYPVPGTVYHNQTRAGLHIVNH